MTITLTPEIQTSLAQQIVANALPIAGRAHVAAKELPGGSLMSLTATEVEALASSIVVLGDVLSGKITI